MIESADIREWRTRDVVDPDGRRIGSLESVYVDTGTDAPAFATVVVGLPTRHRLVFVPLTGAVVGPDYVKVAHDRGKVKDGPSIGTDDVLPAEDEPALFAYFGLPYLPPADGVRVLARR
ncbi:PRC-barrel domain-containing protein [Streptomyces sp. NPDC012389]|uniref:PRC-barrel domain-containing protein n=1 Tax=unclassified Streptomyces TaxID=2593676 RepID=UPI00081D5124|nr:PRC-barrel domain-containing protein [Streptomyces sp. ScaeMP-e83]MYR97629.1 PRC-barrel domain containing protein [Streptomyces sp. SID4937]MYX12240.1 PRC-barrel domain containing protein [Streptomyces sp. SID8374]SCE27919.1 PRC-barrel domain-containing protein [Streptomyces sp. ScaeMP-e83]